MPVPPTVLVRRQRLRGEDWSTDRSWFGGLPRLGDHPWPRGSAGKPLAFLAQIDLAELAEACPQSPLPRRGSLAFFTGPDETGERPAAEGEVVHVSGEHALDTPLPDDAGPVRRVGQYSFYSPGPSATERRTFAKWGIEFCAIDLPADLSDYADPGLHEAIVAALEERIEARFPDCANTLSLRPSRLPWFAAELAQGQILDAVAGWHRRRAYLEEQIPRDEAWLAAAGPGATRDGESAEEIARLLPYKRASRETSLAALDQLPRFAAQLGTLHAQASRWSPMDEGSRAQLSEMLDTIKKRFGYMSEIFPGWLLAKACGIEMAGGDAEAFDGLSDEEIDFINTHCRLSPHGGHQMFGIARELQGDVTAHCDKVMLLQLSFDYMMDWQFGDTGIMRYWIAPSDLAYQRWDRVIHTFEGG